MTYIYILYIYYINTTFYLYQQELQGTVLNRSEHTGPQSREPFFTVLSTNA